MTRRRALLTAAALAYVAGGLALGRWRAGRIRDAARERVARRLAGTAALTRDAARLWAQELARDTRIAVNDLADDAPRPSRPLAGYAGLWQVTRADLAGTGAAAGAGTGAAAGAGDLAPAERAAADSTLADGALRLSGPFAAATPSGIGISGVARLPDGRTAVVLRSDPGPTLFALVARRAARSSENGRFVARAGGAFRVVSPADAAAPNDTPNDTPNGSPDHPPDHSPSAGFTLTDYPLARFTPEVRRLLLYGSPEGAPGHALYRALDGHEVLAVVAPVPGIRWSVVRQLDAAEVDAEARGQLTAEALLLLSASSAVGLGALAVVRSERARRRREVEASEARLAATLRASFDAVLAVDEGECIVFCNAAAERLLRARPGALVGRHVGDIAAPAAREHLLADFRRFVAGEQTAVTIPAEAGVALEACDGTPVPRVEVALSKGEAAGGRLCMCILRDVSDREAAAEALRASEASARGFVDNAPYGICRVAPDGRFLVVNPPLARMLGYPGIALLGAADLGDLYVDPAARAEVLRRHAEGEAVVADVETTWRRLDGTTLPVRINSREVRDADGGVAYYEAFVTDLRALRTAEQALRQAEKLAAVGQFVSGVAHELNNPLAAVLLFTDGLLDEPDRPAADREALGLVREQALRARAIVRDLLAFVRGAGGPPGVVDAREVLLAAARALAPQAAAAGGRLDVALGGDLGRLRVDRGGVEQVVTNLVVNALHAAPGGLVRLTAERDGAALRVTVDDEGPGLAPEVEARMFEPFFTTKPVGGGTGLGLSVSLGIVERYGGALAGANRAPGEAPGLGAGARFTLTLPLAAEPGRGAEAPNGTARDGAAPDAAPGPAGGSAPGRLTAAAGAAPGDAAGPPDESPDAPASRVRAPRLLVVDDEAPIRQALVRFFGRRGWAVDEAGDGRAAFARLLDAEAAGAPYDLVLSDVRMPDVSGVALHDWLARTRPAVLDRVVFATGDDASAESSAFVRRTRCRVLGKPFDADALAALARLPDALGRRPPPDAALGDGAPPHEPPAESDGVRVARNRPGRPAGSDSA